MGNAPEHAKNGALDRLVAKGMASAVAPTNHRTPLCSCGCAEPHVVMRRETADGARLAIWNDGALTHANALGTYVRGLGEPRSNWSRHARRRAVMLVADDLAVFDLAEIPVVVKAAENCMPHTYRSEHDRRVHALAIARRRLARGAA